MNPRLVNNTPTAPPSSSTSTKRDQDARTATQMSTGSSAGELPALLGALLAQNRRLAQRRAVCRSYGGLDPGELRTLYRALTEQRDRLQRSERLAREGGETVEGGPRDDERAAGELRRQRRQMVATAILRQLGGSAVPSEGPEPDAWPIIEALGYFNRVYVPLCTECEIVEDGLDKTNPNHIPMPPYKQRHTFITRAIGLQLSALARVHRVPAQKLHNATHIWTRFYQHMAASLKMINDNMASPKEVRVLNRINDIVNSELSVGSPGWRAHAEGFTTLLRLSGGPEMTLETKEVTYDTLQYMILISILANTTSPPHNQVRGAYYYTDEMICKYYAHYSYDALCCPTYLFVEIQAINRLRVDIATSPNDPSIESRAEAIFDRVLSFDPDEWQEEFYTVPDTSEMCLVALLLKTSVTLYAILTIGPHAPSHTLFQQGYLSAKLSHCGHLLEQIVKIKPTSFHGAVTIWPLAVAGVAAADATATDRDFISTRLLEVSKEVLSGPHSLNVRAVLGGFWEGGLRGWDECYWKPTVAVL